MFKINVEILQNEVSKIVSAAKRSRLTQSYIFVSASKEKGTVSFSFSGELLSVVKTIETEVSKDLSFATSVLEFQLKVSSLPDEVEISVFSSPKDNVQLKWGSGSGITLLTVKENEIALTSPDTSQSISFPEGKWNYFRLNFATFCALPNSKAAIKEPTCTGINFSKTENGIIVQATNSVKAIKSIEEMDWFDTSITIPCDTFYSITELISSNEIVTVSLDKTGSNIIIESSKVLAISRLIDGKFPDTEKLFCDETAPIIWRADRMELLETTRRVKKLGGQTPVMKVFKKDTKHFAVLKDILIEKIGAVVESEVKEGFSVNPNNLEAALTVLRSEEVLLAFTQKTAPITLLSGDEDDDNRSNLKVMIGQVKQN
ncbi:hypothetical protein ACOMCU_22495 [Lysinibacillus sp. UGB7]|uniref:DNA polymerase III subunit beta family protein n=1 Tax=Lysinibacillus sp. UGB7 TaxID=3411039 RepID=UPI003B7B5CC6